jgi:hypothetical protein
MLPPMFPSLFRDSSDHHFILKEAPMAPLNKLFPSLFRDSSDHHPKLLLISVRASPCRFHPSLGIPLIITSKQQSQQQTQSQQVSIPL